MNTSGTWNKLLSLSVIVFAFACQRRCLAENVCFLPGDAFFHGFLTRADISRAMTAKVIEIKYASPKGGDFSGWMGYRRLTIANSSKLSDNILRAHDLVRYEDPLQLRVTRESVHEGNTVVLKKRIIEESNPIGVFIYNSDTTLDKVKIGIKYNESWRTEAALFLTSTRTPDEHTLDEFDRSYAAVAESWVKSTDIPGLRATIPVVKIEKGEAVDVPVACSASEVLAIITSFGNYSDLTNASNGRSIYLVTENSVNFYSGEEGKWVEADIPQYIDEEPGASDVP